MFIGQMPSTNEFTRLHDLARRSEIRFPANDLRSVSVELAGNGNITGLDLVLDDVRKSKLEKNECFYMGFRPDLP